MIIFQVKKITKNKPNIKKIYLITEKSWPKVQEGCGECRACQMVEDCGSCVSCLVSDARHEKTDLKVFVVVITKRRMGVPSYDMTPTFQNLTLLTSYVIFSKSRCHAKRRMAMCAHPSFGMTMTKTLRSVFSDACQMLSHTGVIAQIFSFPNRCVPIIIDREAREITLSGAASLRTPISAA